jgi:hypothetical protein
MLQNSLFDLKIIKLFLLNTMENKEPRKIGLTFLPLSTNFSTDFSSLNSTGPKVAQTAQPAPEQGRARARDGDFANETL